MAVERWLWLAPLLISKHRCATYRSPIRGAYADENYTSGTAGVGQGDPGAAAGTALWYRPALDRRDAARGRGGGNASGAEGQGDHGQRRPRARRRRGRNH